MFPPPLLFAYFGPETVLPMTSVIATVVGLVMMFGKNTFRFVFRWRRPEPTPKDAQPGGQKPHFWQGSRARTPRS